MEKAYARFLALRRKVMAGIKNTEVQVDDVVRIVMFRKDGKNGI